MSDMSVMCCVQYFRPKFIFTVMTYIYLLHPFILHNIYAIYFKCNMYVFKDSRMWWPEWFWAWRSNVLLCGCCCCCCSSSCTCPSSLFTYLSAIAGARTHKLIGIRIFIFTSHVHSNVISTSQYLCNVYVQCIFACNEYTETEACVMFTTLKD